MSALDAMISNFGMLLHTAVDELSSKEYNFLFDLIEPAKSEYKALCKGTEFLEALEECGVDNWPGYSDAYALLEDK
jgi:hypothetical protein